MAQGRDMDETSFSDATRLMTQGGDARLHLSAGTGLNRYFSAPRPSGVLAYASSPANDISQAAYARAEQVLAELGRDIPAATYGGRLGAPPGTLRPTPGGS